MANGFCDGCGVKLGWKKYRFTKLWRIPGVYCRDCMIKIGKNFEESNTGGITLLKQECSFCKNEFYFLSEKENNSYCHCCFQSITNNSTSPNEQTCSVPNSTVEPVRQMNKNYGAARKYVLFVGGTGVIFLIAGLVFTFYFTANDPTVFTFLYGSVPSVMGLILLRRAFKTRSMFFAKH